MGEVQEVARRRGGGTSGRGWAKAEEEGGAAAAHAARRADEPRLVSGEVDGEGSESGGESDANDESSNEPLDDESEACDGNDDDSVEGLRVRSVVRCVAASSMPGRANAPADEQNTGCGWIDAPNDDDVDEAGSTARAAAGPNG